MSSIKPANGSSQINGGEEVASRFVVTCGDGAILFEATKEVLDKVAGLVKFFVVVPLFLAVFLGRDHDFFSCFAQGDDNALIGIIPLVCQNSLGFKGRQKYVGSVKITRLSGR